MLLNLAGGDCADDLDVLERDEKGAFIPAPNKNLQDLKRVGRDLLAFIQRRHPATEATLDIDATLIETHKATALYCYKHFKSYQPLNVWWAEQGLVAHTEFRDGNVPAGWQILRVLEEALDVLPEGVKKVRVRSDTAGYQHELRSWRPPEPAAVRRHRVRHWLRRDAGVQEGRGGAVLVGLASIHAGGRLAKQAGVGGGLLRP